MSLSLLMTGCNSGSDNGKPASQVAASVNAEEISVHQVNDMLASMGEADPATLPSLRHAILEKLVDQELAVQAAMDHKLDRTPAVMQALEAARREVLAKAYLDQFASGITQPTQPEIDKYYQDHPELFSQRRLYILQQILVASNADLLHQARDKVRQGKSISQLAEWLTASKARFSIDNGARASEQIPMDVLENIRLAKNGETLTIEQPGAMLILHVTSSMAQPLEESAVKPRIRQYLVNQRWSETISGALKQLRRQATIEYAGEFSASPPSSAKSSLAVIPKAGLSGKDL